MTASIQTPWLGQTGVGGSPFEDVLSLTPHILETYREFYGTLWDDHLVPADILELCRLRVAQLHVCESELAIRDHDSGVTEFQVEQLSRWQESGAFSDSQRAALDYAELIPWQHHDVTDAMAEAVKAHLGEGGYVAFCFAVCFFDANCRLRQVLELPPVANAPGEPPASRDGILY